MHPNPTPASSLTSNTSLNNRYMQNHPLVSFFFTLRQQIRKEDHHAGDQWDLVVRVSVGCLSFAGLGELRPRAFWTGLLRGLGRVPALPEPLHLHCVTLSVVCTFIPCLLLLFTYLSIAWKLHKAYQSIQNHPFPLRQHRKEDHPREYQHSVGRLPRDTI